MRAIKVNKLAEWINQVIQGDCLELMKALPDSCIDLVLSDPPYEITACEWDSIIPLEPMWRQLKRIIKPNGVIVMTASQPFTTTLIASNMKMFKYEWIWDKKRGSNFLTTKYQPMKEHENIIVFYNNNSTYNPINIERKGNRYERAYNTSGKSQVYNVCILHKKKNIMRCPKSILEFSADVNNQFKKQRFHPSQKPIALMEYLIKTYSNKGDIVLDFAMGSGTTCVAAKGLDRLYIGMELKLKYVEIAKKRLVETGISTKAERLEAKVLLTFEDLVE